MNIREKFFRGKRWYIKLDSPLNGKTVVAFAVYVWLKANPIFIDIPKGYLVHHLDHNEQNDDITNLVIMQKHQHAAHHIKAKIIKPELQLDADSIKLIMPERTVYFPVHEPTIDQYKPGLFRIRFYEKIDEITNRISLYKWEGHTFKSFEDAQKVKNAIVGVENGLKAKKDYVSNN